MAKQKQYWFKRRRYGWGWTPVTWQGWLSVGFIVLFALLAALQIPPKPHQPTTTEILRFFITMVIVVSLTVIISTIKGPSPRWRWGKKPTDNSHEDF